jgi:uncharacterized protein GlcG (DUF336 family)
MKQTGVRLARLRQGAPLVVAKLSGSAIMAWLALTVIGCSSDNVPFSAVPTDTANLTVQDVQTLIAQGVEQTVRLARAGAPDRVGIIQDPQNPQNQITITVPFLSSIAVTDREGNVLGVFRMTRPGVGGGTITTRSLGSLSIAKARTAAYLSSNQHAFTSLTACFITRSHFPPGVFNSAAGPLYGVGFSQLPNGDIQPNGDIRAALVGGALADFPGGVPVYKNGRLAGGLGADIDQGTRIFNRPLCAIPTEDEIIALGAILGYDPPTAIRGDNIFIDGIQLLYQNVSTPPGNFTFTYNDSVLGIRGFVDPNFPIRATPAPKFPVSGQVVLNNVPFSPPANPSGRTPSWNFSSIPGTVLSAADVQTIINQATAQAAITRAAIRNPLGSAAQVFIAVSDVNGIILGISRTPDATMFSFDVSAQKARTAVVFSKPSTLAPVSPSDTLGVMIRRILGIPINQDLAMTTRAVGFLSQRYYPPGIDRDSQGNPTQPGPLWMTTPIPGFLIGDATNFDFEYQRSFIPPPVQPPQPQTQPPYGNGITIFPGGIPLYKNGVFAGAIGISGDGVDQDDLIAGAGAAGFEPPTAARCDQIIYRNVRLPYTKFPRRPNL